MNPLRLSHVTAAFLMAIGCLSCSSKHDNSQAVILDVRAIVNKNPHEVEGILGKPDSVYTLQMMGKSVFCQLYNNIEIQYPQSAATDIAVSGSNGLPFNQTALAAFNLDYNKKHPSDYRKDSYIRWSQFDEFSAISFYDPKKDSMNRITDFKIFFKAKLSN